MDPAETEYCSSRLLGDDGGSAWVNRNAWLESGDTAVTAGSKAETYTLVAMLNPTRGRGAGKSVSNDEVREALLALAKKTLRRAGPRRHRRQLFLHVNICNNAHP